MHMPARGQGAASSLSGHMAERHAPQAPPGWPRRTAGARCGGTRAPFPAPLRREDREDKVNSTTDGPRPRAAAIPGTAIRTATPPAQHAGDSPDDPDHRAWLAALIEGSDDAIISKDLDGVIRTWNYGAERMFGYAAGEIIGRPVTVLIPDDLQEEEPQIMAAIRSGHRLDHFETRRRRKDGSPVDISLTISPIFSRQGQIVGASKIARDISGWRRLEEQRQLLIGEMQHRIKNLFAMAGAVVSLSMRAAPSAEAALALVGARMNALARAHEATVACVYSGAAGGLASSLRALLEAIGSPYETGGRVVIDGPDVEVSGAALGNLALILHELATNSAKYGALSVVEGRLCVRINVDDALLRLVWTEITGRPPEKPREQGFGSRLEQRLAAALGARIKRDWLEQGLRVRMSAPRAALAG